MPWPLRSETGGEEMAECKTQLIGTGQYMFLSEDKVTDQGELSPQGAGRDLSIVTTQKVTCRGGHLLPAFSFCPDNNRW